MTTLISSQVASGNAVTFTGIPGGYTDLVLDIAGVSHNNATNANIRLELSPDGANWTAPVLVFYGNAGIAFFARLVLEDYGEDVGAWSRVQFVPGTNTANASFAGAGWVCAGGIQAIRISTSAGNFDAGTILLSGR